MANYFRITESDNVPESLKNKPKWVLCLLCTITVVVMVASAITAGVFIGYTYCYMEHKTRLTSGNVTQSGDLQILQSVYKDSPEEAYKRTINGAMKSVLISRIRNISNFLWRDDTD